MRGLSNRSSRPIPVSHVREVILASSLAVDIRSATMQATTKGIGVPQFNLDHIHAKLVHLFGLIHFGLFNADRLGVEHSTFMLSHVEE